MQVQNISMVDVYLEDLESDLLSEYLHKEKTPIPSTIFVSAISQMWIFSFYELLRTWRQQVREFAEYGEQLSKLEGDDRMKTISGQLTKIEKASSKIPFEDVWYKEGFEKAERPDYVGKLNEAYQIIEPLFRKLERVRVTLAKHEIPKTRGFRAMAPGYGRIDNLTGSITWTIFRKDEYVEVISRRSIADDCKSLIKSIK